jgi:ATP-dependent DNA ligase
MVRSMDLPIEPPIEPMLAKASPELPQGEGWLYEPKWDGFRALVFRDGEDLFIQSRDRKPLDRYFPELRAPLLSSLPQRCVLDGEIVIATGDSLDFDALLLRIHPAASRVARLAERSPASYVAWDLLAIDDRSLLDSRQDDRRAQLEAALRDAAPPIHLTPLTRDPEIAADWFARFEGAGLDGVIAKEAAAAYEPGKRRMRKIKHARTADCVVAGFRWHKNGRDTHVGSLILGLFDDEGSLHHVGVTSSFKWDRREELAKELAPWREGAIDGHPWEEWATWSTAVGDGGQRMPGATSRWNRGKDLSWEPLRAERVCEVAYDHLQGDRFRHATTFRRWRPDKPPSDCRYDQLETTAPYELRDIFAKG